MFNTPLSKICWIVVVGLTFRIFANGCDTNKIGLPRSENLSLQKNRKPMLDMQSDG